MIDKPFDAVTKEDIEALLANGQTENKTLEYKEILPGNSDGDKKEFLADISAFANAAGGDVLYGVSEQRDSSNKPTGVPSAVNGLGGINAGAEILRLENILRTGLAPRINGVQMKAIDGFASGPVIMMRIPKSWNAPHMVATGDSRFFSRNNAGKYPLDVTQIKAAFIQTEGVGEKVRRFRDERIGRIVANELPTPMPSSGKVVLHIVPLQSLDPSFSINLKIAAESTCLGPMMAALGRNSRYNFDGFLNYDGARGQVSLGYVQVFRNGVIEAVEGTILSWSQAPDNSHLIVNPRELEKAVAEALKRYMQALAALNIAHPYFVLLTLTGVLGKYVAFTPRYLHSLHSIDRDVLFLPEVFVENADEKNPFKILRPVYDAMWQASGAAGSLNYDANGEWKPPRNY